MRLVTTADGFGRLEGDDYVPMGDDLVAWLGGAPAHEGTPRPAAGLALRAPVPRPGKIVCVGLNYRDHAEEAGKPVPEEPVLFAKFANSVTDPGATVVIPSVTKKADYEGELAVVIGRRARRVGAQEALDAVAGYTCVNDLSARDLQWSQGQWTRGKAVDGFLPMGPQLVTPDEIGDPHALGIRTMLNGEIVQESNTSNLVFGVAELISFISATVTLEPGDVLATGTPGGVGSARTPPRFLRDGDRLVVEIDGIGRLATTMAVEPPG